MAYTVMKLHKRYLMPMESLDEFCNYLQIKLEKNFCFDDDTVISTMERSMEELKRAKLDYPGLPLPQELPRYPFGTFKEPSFTNKVLSECFCLLQNGYKISSISKISEIYFIIHNTRDGRDNLRDANTNAEQPSKFFFY